MEEKDKKLIRSLEDSKGWAEQDSRKGAQNGEKLEKTRKSDLYTKKKKSPL